MAGERVSGRSRDDKPEAAQVLTSRSMRMLAGRIGIVGCGCKRVAASKVRKKGRKDEEINVQLAFNVCQHNHVVSEFQRTSSNFFLVLGTNMGEFLLFDM